MESWFPDQGSPRAVEAQSLNHWITREVSSNSFDYSKVTLTLWEALRGQAVLDASGGLSCGWPGSEGEVLTLGGC